MPLAEPAVWFPTIRAGTGADVYVERLCAGLNARGIRAEITWLPQRAEYLPRTVAVPPPPAWANIVHVNSWLPQRFHPAGLPLVATVHHLVHDPLFAPYRSRLQALYHRTLIRPRERKLIRKAAAVICCADYVSRTVSEFSGRGDVQVIPNWVDVGAFQPGSAARVPGRPFTLFMAGSRTRRKGFDLLPRFVSALGPGFELRYAGGNSGPIDLPGVVDLGRLDETSLVREYQQCDAVVSLSRYEGFGYTAVEGMACGKPFLGFASSALAEVVPPQAGCLVDLDDIDALARAALHLAQNANIAAAQGDAARAWTLKHFQDGNVEKYIKLYRTITASSMTRKGDS